MPSEEYRKHEQWKGDQQDRISSIIKARAAAAGISPPYVTTHVYDGSGHRIHICLPDGGRVASLDDLLADGPEQPA